LCYYPGQVAIIGLEIQFGTARIEFLNSLEVEYAVVEIEDVKNDPRGFRKLPAIAYVSQGGYHILFQGLEEIK